MNEAVKWIVKNWKIIVVVAIILYLLSRLRL